MKVSCPLVKRQILLRSNSGSLHLFRALSVSFQETANHGPFKTAFNTHLMQRGIDHFSGDSVQLTCDVHLRLDVVGQVFIWEDIVNAVTSKTNELWSVSKTKILVITWSVAGSRSTMVTSGSAETNWAVCARFSSSLQTYGQISLFGAIRETWALKRHGSKRVQTKDTAIKFER